MTTTETLSIGDSVLVKHKGNEVPGVVSDLHGDRVMVSLAEPYLAETGEPQTQTDCARDDVVRISDDANAQPELPQ